MREARLSQNEYSLRRPHLDDWLKWNGFDLKKQIDSAIDPFTHEVVFTQER